MSDLNDGVIMWDDVPIQRRKPKLVILDDDEKHGPGSARPLSRRSSMSPGPVAAARDETDELDFL